MEPRGHWEVGVVAVIVLKVELRSKQGSVLPKNVVREGRLQRPRRVKGRLP